METPPPDLKIKIPTMDMIYPSPNDYLLVAKYPRPTINDVKLVEITISEMQQLEKDESLFRLSSYIYLYGSIRSLKKKLELQKDIRSAYFRVENYTKTNLSCIVKPEESSPSQ
jgi:hypothetical protein